MLGCVRKHFICELLLKGLTVSCTGFSVLLDASHQGTSLSLRDGRIVADSLARHPQCRSEVRLRCQRELQTRGVPHRRIQVWRGVWRPMLRS
jgi:hypothetical protein